MAVTDWLARVKLIGESGLPTDVYVNDWVFHVDIADQTDADGIAANLGDDFYNFTNTFGDTLSSDYLATTLDRDVVVDLYDLTGHLDGSPVGSPAFTSGFTLDAAVGATPNLPEEVAVCFSYEADLTGIVEKMPNPSPPPSFIRPAARRRGRLYIGPLSRSALSESGTGVRPNLALVRSLTSNGTHFLSTMGADWVQWSRVDATTREIVGGFVDNAFDTQRRRGVPPNGRTDWS